MTHLSTAQTAQRVYKSTLGIRRLIQSGKLEAIRSPGGRYHVSLASLELYVNGLPHPPQGMSWSHTLDNCLGGLKRLNRYASMVLSVSERLRLEQHLSELEPFVLEFKALRKARRYEALEGVYRRCHKMLQGYFDGKESGVLSASQLN